ncbi:DUF357 domain-containing protein [Candidatus Woesearchaeota archaeon]|nr:DUF357 domain-containing protein [Candidatus Woesearchaeota archaeon]
MTEARAITDSKLDKYFSVTDRAIRKAKSAISQIPEKKKAAEDFLDMAERYLSDAKHFKSKGDYVSAFGAVNYAHAWLDAGARLGFFEVHDNELFAAD